jgi:hypothetical protein
MTKICFGICLEPPRVAAALGVKYGDVKAKKCPFCGKEGSAKANFCWNCGTGLRTDVAAIAAPEVVELVMLHRPPPRSVTVFHFEQVVFVCQVLAENETCAKFEKPVAHFPWLAVRSAITQYAATIGYANDCPEPVLFAIGCQAYTGGNK